MLYKLTETINEKLCLFSDGIWVETLLYSVTKFYLYILTEMPPAKVTPPFTRSLNKSAATYSSKDGNKDLELVAKPSDYST